jgi:hypothetical protein
MTFAYTATAIAVTSTAASIYSAEKGRSAQKKASKKQERQSRVQSARAAMSPVRQQRIAQAQIMQGASSQGTQGSSAAQGGYSAVGALTSGNMQFLNQMDNMNSQVSSLMRSSQKYAGQANNYNALSNLAMQGYGMTEGGGGGTNGGVDTQNPTNRYIGVT